MNRYYATGVYINSVPVLKTLHVECWGAKVTNCVIVVIIICGDL